MQKDILHPTQSNNLVQQNEATLLQKAVDEWWKPGKDALEDTWEAKNTGVRGTQVLLLYAHMTQIQVHDPAAWDSWV